MGEDVHARRVEPTEERLVSFVLSVHEVEGCGEELFVDSFHSLLRQRASVFNLSVGVGMNHSAWTEAFLERRVLRIVRILWFFFRVEVIEVAEELIKPMFSRQELILVAKVILAKLTCRVTERFKDLGDGWVLGTQANICAG